MDSNVLRHLREDIPSESKSLHSLLVVRHGAVVIEAYWPGNSHDKKAYLNSATKVILSALVGIAVQDGKLHESDLALSFFPPSILANSDARKKKISIRHLLTMSSGIAWPQLPPPGENASDEMGHSSDWVPFILNRSMAAEPGTVINYSNGDSHLLSAILQKATGVTAFEFARKRLFEPLGTRDVAWDHDPQGHSIGSAALQMRPIDRAKLGCLYLGGGEFRGRRIINRDWIDRSLAPHVKMPAKGVPVDYGYYWWLYPERNLCEAWGGAGQRIALFRDLDLAVVMTADIPTDFPRAPVAARIYDGIRRSVKSSNPLPANPSAVSDLKDSITELTAK